jgi:ankyrin repeat protein
MIHGRMKQKYAILAPLIFLNPLKPETPNELLLKGARSGNAAMMQIALFSRTVATSHGIHIFPGADVDCQDPQGKTPLMHIIELDLSQEAEAAREQKESIYLNGLLTTEHANFARNLLTLRSYAPGNSCQMKSLGLLLYSNASTQPTDQDGNTVLILAAQRGLKKIARDLLAHDQGASCNHQDELKRTALMWSIINEHAETTHFILSYNPNLELVDVNGNSALIYGVINTDVETTCLLLEKGASVPCDISDKIQWVNCTDITNPMRFIKLLLFLMQTIEEQKNGQGVSQETLDFLSSENEALAAYINSLSGNAPAIYWRFVEKLQSHIPSSPLPQSPQSSSLSSSGTTNYSTFSSPRREEFPRSASNPI